MNRRGKLLGATAAAAILAAAPTARASSHREALAILNEPCADNTDFYAWVSPGAHDKLYLIGNYNPLHEPGQGNQGLRACDGYRYDFHIARGTSLDDKVIYSITFKKSVPVDGPPGPGDPLGGGNELLYQISGSTEQFWVQKYVPATGERTMIGSALTVAPNNHGPQTDRLVYGLGPFAGYDSGDPTSREVGLYKPLNYAQTFVQDLSNGGRVWTGQAADPYYLDEKGIFDVLNLSRDGLFGIPGARSSPGEDVFDGFNLWSIALEIPMSEIFPHGIPHNGTFVAGSTDSLVRMWFSISRKEKEIVDPTNVITGYRYEGPYKQVGRQGNPLFNAAVVGVARQTLYLRSNPKKDVTNFGADILFPILVRDADNLGIYRALGIDPNAAGLFGPRNDIINALNLGRPIPVADGSTGDVITLDASIGNDVVPDGVLEGGYPNGRQLIGGPTPRAEHRDVSDLLISLIVAGDPLAGAGDGVNEQDDDYLTEFPFVPPAHQGLFEGHGAPRP